MKIGKLMDVDGKTVKGWREWLKKEQCGCCSVCFGETDKYRYCVCVGWHDDGDGWKIAWKIGRQTRNSVMQSDFDIDFEMPYNRETGDIDDTTQEIALDETSRMGEWNELAAEMRKTARRVWKDWRGEETPE